MQIIERMEDTCSPDVNKKLQSFRAYTIIIPTALIILFLEGVFILATIPGSLGSALTIKGTLPQLPASAAKL